MKKIIKKNKHIHLIKRIEILFHFWFLFDHQLFFKGFNTTENGAGEDGKC